VFCRAAVVHAGGVGSGHAEFNGTESFANSVHENCNSVSRSVSSTDRFHHEHPAEAHSKTGNAYFVNFEFVSLLDFWISGVEAKKSVGRFCQVLPEDKTPEFPGAAAASGCPVGRRIRYVSRHEAAVDRPRPSFHWEPGKILKTRFKSITDHYFPLQKAHVPAFLMDVMMGKKESGPADVHGQPGPPGED
jgi:hypothetical protein